MCPGTDVFLHRREEYVAQVPRAEYHAMINTFPANFERHLRSLANRQLRTAAYNVWSDAPAADA